MAAAPRSNLCKRLLAAGIMPVVRLYRLEPNPGHIGAREEETVRRLVAEGVRYFETNSEPDLPAEWKGGRMPPTGSTSWTTSSTTPTGSSAWAGCPLSRPWL